MIKIIVIAVLILLAGLILIGVTAETSNLNESCLKCQENQKECKVPNIGNDGQTRYKIKCCELSQECAQTDEEKPSPYCKSPECKWSLGLRRHFSESYNPEKECCTESGPKPKYPIERLYDCSKTLTARPEATPEANGCGTKEFPVQSRFGKADFTAACNAHDICYDTCNSGETVCNDKFYELMQAECKRAYPAQGKNQTQCLNTAYKYRYEGGIASRMIGAYETAQKRVCQCCSDQPAESGINFILPQILTE